MTPLSESIYSRPAVLVDDHIYSIPETARWLRRSVSWLNKERAVGRGPIVVRMGERGVGHLGSDIRAYIQASRQVHSGSEAA